MIDHDWWITSKIINALLAMTGIFLAVLINSPTGLFLFNPILFITMALSYWLRAEVDDLLNEDTFFDSSDYSCLLEDTDWA